MRTVTCTCGRSFDAQPFPLDSYRRTKCDECWAALEREWETELFFAKVAFALRVTERDRNQAAITRRA